ncbi:hypothetical protein K458DRAFT_426620 [Lentithecium fluviatile CBS 122367]|uniref:Uncharacterized protein n=1 Tax=Lentithecium fluviatile CBS 122367 TaxID=1168545 RepID=A0A6G1JLB3_9PLEO|nr:hypothetical protein K458DRAFT_426620 [Lentithecium fluviatile CBS 122367]
MSTQDEELLLSLESSLRNALATFGPSSQQYRSIKYMVDEQAAKIALRKLSLNAEVTAKKEGRMAVNLPLRPKGV